LAGIAEGVVFRAMTRHSRLSAKRISPQAVFEIVRTYAQQLDAGVSPHDLRRFFARLAHLG